MSKRIIFVNLHANEFLVKTASKFLFKHSCAIKHKYLLDYLLESPDYEVCTFINRYGFSLSSNLPRPIQHFLDSLRFLEHRWIMHKNGISQSKVKVLRKASQIRPDDIVISHRIVASSLKEIADIPAFKAVSTLHFHGEQRDSDLMKAAKPDVLFNECDLGRYSEIFRRYYGWYDKSFIVHPFVAAPRFKRIKPFAERECKVFSTGTITYKKHPEFLATYGDPCDQPSRKQILDNAEALKPWVECYNANYEEDTPAKIYLPTDGKLKHYYKVFYNSTHAAQQKKYFSFDMVEKFNEYKMCIIGEEVLGIPGIGFVEGMSCGCAYIGQTIGYYEDYGMKEGVHYIGYDGTLDDLKAKISYYQQPEHQEELERIANAGYEFAREHFNGPAVAKELMRKLGEKREE